ncbi:MAG: decaprenyl-phosphate phosphoribosyltransferase [Chloroflexi bacterium]|nr:decaprenyl-phosphate phosphoribosyltransferase [Chloroflexota bacterium]
MEQRADIASSTPPALRDQAVALGLVRELRPLLVATRPRQWIKNGLVSLAFAFSVGQAWTIGDVGSWLPLTVQVGIAFIAFCAVASAEYLINDLRDIERDRLHPKKRRRPIAAGTLRPRTAVVAAVLLVLAGTALGSALGWRFTLALAGYAALSLAYSVTLKHMVILDILALAIGFVMRAVGGALAISVPVSPWLYLCTLLGALFIAIYKRRHELTLLDAGAAEHRPILAEYTTGLLDQMAGVVTASTVVAYSLYTVTAENLPRNNAMLGTVPFVLYGVFRYMYLVHRHDFGGSPEEILLKDRPMQVTVALWIVTAMVILGLSRG